MPQLDKTGPSGQGARTGRDLGPCGYGSGPKRHHYISPKNELAALEDKERALEEELAAVREEKAALQNQSK